MNFPLLLGSELNNVFCISAKDYVINPVTHITSPSIYTLHIVYYSFPFLCLVNKQKTPPAVRVTHNACTHHAMKNLNGFFLIYLNLLSSLDFIIRYTKNIPSLNAHIKIKPDAIFYFVDMS